jgi:hypothetical protein
MTSNRAIRPRRSLVLREVDGLLAQAEQLRTKVRNASTKGPGNTPEIDDARTLHPIIDRLEVFLGQLKTLTQHRSKP